MADDTPNIPERDGRLYLGMQDVPIENLTTEFRNAADNGFLYRLSLIHI